MNYKDVFAYLINKQKILINFFFFFFLGGVSPEMANKIPAWKILNIFRLNIRTDLVSFTECYNTDWTDAEHQQLTSFTVKPPVDVNSLPLCGENLPCWG